MARLELPTASQLARSQGRVREVIRAITFVRIMFMSGTGNGGYGHGQGPGSNGSCNPRKFSEKIALLTQRQAEDTAAFQEVMMDITSTRVSQEGRPPLLLGAARDRQVGYLAVKTFESDGGRGVQFNFKLLDCIPLVFDTMKTCTVLSCLVS